MQSQETLLEKLLKNWSFINKAIDSEIKKLIEEIIIEENKTDDKKFKRIL